MAQPQQGDRSEIAFQSVQLFKAESLGIGSYGIVYKAKCGDLLCAAKVLHPILFYPTLQRERRLPISRFEQECDFLGSIKHPNIVQYLGTHQDTENGLVLLMELMDQSLTSFLEKSEIQLPYHIEVTISHDIALALSFLHSNDIIHRDLSSNNVLMIGSIRAKVTDFGMAKLAEINPQATRVSLTQAPGANAFMSPEATQIPPDYSEKLDCFSHGVLAVQIMTRQFPNPGTLLKTIQIEHPNFPTGSVQVAVPEVERRQEHISLINQTHPLLAVALDCLKNESAQRPSAQEICDRLVALKQAPRFTQSTRELATPQQSVADEGITVRELQQELQTKNQELQTKSQEIQQQLSAKDDVIREKDKFIVAENPSVARYQQEIQQLSQEKETKDRELQWLRQERMAAELQQSSLKKQLRQLESRDGGAKGPASIKLTWRDGKKALLKMYRVSGVVVTDSMMFLRPVSTEQIHGYVFTSEKWFTLQDCFDLLGFNLAVIDNVLTAIGGRQRIFWREQPSDMLLSLTVEGQHKKWIQKFPSMPTKRYKVCLVLSGTTLIVIGGEGKGDVVLCTVEVMDTNNKCWMTAASLPEPLSRASATICGDRIYVLGAFNSSHISTNSVFSCSLSALLQSCEPLRSAADSTIIWSKVADLPVTLSTCVTFQGRLLAIGGFDLGLIPTTAVRMYDPTTNSWETVSHMLTGRHLCFAAILPHNELIVVGGTTIDGNATDSVEIASLSLD